MLHQTGFNRGDSPRSYRTVNAHFAILQDGALIQLHRSQDYLYASNYLNARSMAVEFVGNMPSERGRVYREQRFGRHRITTG